MKYHNDIEYNPLQKLTAKYVDSDCNLVVLAPTSSGKTIVAEQYIFPAINRGERAIYLSPLKALTTEKLSQWDHIPSKVAITSDYKQTPINHSLVLMTTETLDSKTRGLKNWLLKTTILVCDEAHLLSSPGRGDAFEVGITRFSNINSSARIIFLSATIPNAQELGEWLTTLNGKPTEVVETSWRPVAQQHNLIKTSDNYWEFVSHSQNLIKKVSEKTPQKQILVFVHTIGMGHMLAKALNAPFHYSKIEKSKRAEIEKNFRERETPILVATSTLAYGLNLPADIGFIVGGKRGPVDVDPSDIKQEAGRIGRYGLSEEGYVYYIFQKSYADSLFALVQNTPDVKSVLSERLYFHITSFIAREKMQRAEIESFVKKTLCYQQKQLSIQSALSMLLQYKIIEESEEGFKATSLGRAAALMYIDPIDLYYLRLNLQDYPRTSTTIGIAFANIPSYEYPTYVPKDLSRPIELPYGQQTIVATSIRDWIEGKKMQGTLSVIVPQLINDIERWTSALAISGLDKDYLNSISLMLKYGVRESMLELISLKEIGRTRAYRLYQHGISTVQHLRDNHHVAKNILGSALYNRVISSIDSPQKIILSF